MPIMTMPHGALESNACLVHNNYDAVVVDPPDSPERLEFAIRNNGLTLRAILVTHLHFDHVGGCAEWCRLFGLPAQVGQIELKHLDVLEKMNNRFGYRDFLDFPYQALDEGDISFGSLAVRVLLTPGHSPGSLSFYFPEESVLCSGDLLFKGSIGRTDFPGGSFEDLCASLRGKIYGLPPETMVYPGHGPQTTVGAEAVGNPFCRVEV